ncbi:aldo/keto reductase [candidate division KSB1 bacterium]|nr:aldo/keto reductase [candidate division KSB1 bacterium]
MPKQNMSRKEFIKKTSGLVAAGLLSPAFGEAEPQFRILGRSGIKVTVLGFGASRTMEPSLLKSALDTGINFLDTGRGYSNGQNEVMVGNVIKEFRKNVVVQSKVDINVREKGDRLKTSAVTKKIKQMMETSLNESLQALQTDYIDTLLIHGAESEDIINHEAVQTFFTDAKKSGKIRACGFSSHENQVALLKANNKSKFYDVVMVPYNHKGSYVHSRSGRFNEWDQPALEEEMRIAEKNNIAIIAMKTCSGGTYSPSPGITPSFAEGLKWILRHSYIRSIAVAMGNMDEINENIKVMYKGKK